MRTMAPVPARATRATSDVAAQRAHVLAQRAAQHFLDTGRNVLDQDVWWTGADGITRAIDDLDESHRANIARWLIDRAPAWHLRSRRNQIIANFWDYVHHSYDKDWGPVNDDEPTGAQIAALIRDEQAAGAHLTWMPGKPLFRRMVSGLPADLVPAVAGGERL